MNIQEINKELGNIDLYLLDQILKNNIPTNAKILDAGCGEGRNLTYFLNNNYDVSGIDINPEAIRMLQFILGSSYPHVSKDKFKNTAIQDLKLSAEVYDYVICSAVLHFAENDETFQEMIEGLEHVLAVDGTLFIRMASDIGLNGHIELGNGTYGLPDGSTRYLLDQKKIDLLLKRRFERIEPVKTVMVDKMRCMTTLVLRKKE